MCVLTVFRCITVAAFDAVISVSVDASPGQLVPQTPGLLSIHGVHLFSPVRLAVGQVAERCCDDNRLAVDAFFDQCLSDLSSNGAQVGCFFVWVVEISNFTFEELYTGSKDHFEIFFGRHFIGLNAIEVGKRMIILRITQGFYRRRQTDCGFLALIVCSFTIQFPCFYYYYFNSICYFNTNICRKYIVDQLQFRIGMG